MNSNTTNAAGRVYQILREAKRQEGTKSVKEVWAAVLGASPERVHTVYARLVRFEEEFEEAERLVRALDVNHDLYLKFFPAVRKAIAPTNLDASWNKFQSVLTEEALTSLEFCSDLLNTRSPERGVPPDDLADLAAEVNDLLESILHSDMPATAQQVLADLARSMQDALVEYRIRGVRGMRALMFDIMARIERNLPILEPEKEHKEVGRFMTLLAHWDTVTSAVLNTSQLAGPILPPLLKMSGLG
jgi:hypothetical protein